jgi:hypothetical protein
MRFLPVVLLSAFLLTGCLNQLGEALSSQPSFEERETYVQNHPERPAHIKHGILDGVPIEGMTEADLRAALGPPDRVNRSSEGPDQWIFDPINTTYDWYVYVEDGKVTSWQQI